MANRLADATSPYLQQHANNPVDWWPWSPEAFLEAERRGVPVLVSVGYSACHWCHVMAHESFEDEQTAAVMNAGFVNVKVDREERPDVDAVYMAATQAMTGQGGWPMTVFTTPKGEPFFCGTYFPASSRPGMPSFRLLLESVGTAWRERRAAVERAGAGVVRALEAATPTVGELAPPTAEQLHAGLTACVREFDSVRGGFGDAPKFPPAMTCEYLLRHHARTGAPAAGQMVARTCRAMARGGIYDQLGGGFARYSVDSGWVVPHFEKMLYDNALLLRVYAHWWRAAVAGSGEGWPDAESGDVALARRVALETAEFLVRDLRTAEGGFAASLDADSEGVEGRYYVWTPAELSAALGEDDGRWAGAVWGLTEAGTFEHGASVLQLREEPDDSDRYARVRAGLFTARSLRVPPGRDDKVVAAWNGLAVAALAEAGALFDRPDLVKAAVGAAELLCSAHRVDGRLRRASRDGRAGSPAGVLEDYGDVAEGLLALYAVTGDDRWLGHAGTLLEVVLTRFPDGAGGFFDTADDAEALVRRPRDPGDNAAPSGLTAVTGALLSYAAYTGSARHREAAERALGVIGGLLATYPPRFLGWGLAVAEAYRDGPREVAVVGPAGDPGTRVLHRAALGGTAPGAVVALGDPAGSPQVALLRDRPLRDGRPTAYVCRHFVCGAPTTDPAELTATLGSEAPPHASTRAIGHLNRR